MNATHVCERAERKIDFLFLFVQAWLFEQFSNQSEKCDSLNLLDFAFIEWNFYEAKT